MSFLPPLIHLGYQKTASTFLQKEIFSNAERFAAPWGQQSAEAIEYFLLEHPCQFDPAAIRAQFAQFTQTRPVISHEDLLGYPIYGRYYAESAVQRMAQAFPDARLLVCIREQNSIILSNYFQYIRQGGTLSLHDMLTSNLGRTGFRPILQLEHFKYDLMHEIITRYFNPEHVLFLPVELLKQRPLDFLNRIYAFVDLAPVQDSKTQVMNRRSSGGALKVERLLNSLLPNPTVLPRSYADYPLRVRLRNKLVKATDVITRSINTGDGFADELSRQIEAHVGDYFADSNTRLSSRLPA